MLLLLLLTPFPRTLLQPFLKLVLSLPLPRVSLVSRLATLAIFAPAALGRSIFGAAFSASGAGHFLRLRGHELDGFAARVIVKLFHGAPEISRLFRFLHDE